LARGARGQAGPLRIPGNCASQPSKRARAATAHPKTVGAEQIRIQFSWNLESAVTGDMRALVTGIYKQIPDARRLNFWCAVTQSRPAPKGPNGGISMHRDRRRRMHSTSRQRLHHGPVPRAIPDPIMVDPIDCRRLLRHPELTKDARLLVLVAAGIGQGVTSFRRIQRRVARAIAEAGGVEAAIAELARARTRISRIKR
jgi:hypothetical protein